MLAGIYICIYIYTSTCVLMGIYIHIISKLMGKWDVSTSVLKVRLARSDKMLRPSFTYSRKRAIRYTLHCCMVIPNSEHSYTEREHLTISGIPFKVPFSGGRYPLYLPPIVLMLRFCIQLLQSV